MGTKETIMSIDNYLDEVGWSMKRDTTCLTYAWLKQAIERQAEISFNSALQEAGNWLRDKHLTSVYDAFVRKHKLTK